MNIRATPSAAAVVLALVAAAPTPTRTGFEVSYPTASALGKWVGRSAEAALAAAAAGHPVDARKQAEAAFAVAARYAGPRDVDAVREAAFARRLLTQIKHAPEADRGELLAYLRAHAGLAHTLAFAVRDGDDVSGVYALLDRLRRERPAQLDRFPELAVALCVVRDKPLHVQLNENRVKAADPVDLFDYFTGHERQMFYGLRGVPVELLCYVVDTVASPAELTWAADHYTGTRDVGRLFFTIDYDTAYYAGTAQKKVDHAPGGYTLPNVLKYGGVCIDQAYFATAVGKALGIPTAIATASSAEAGHAWVGYLRSNGKSAAWDFDAGRYDDYKGLRGDVTDPQTGATIADSTVSLLGDLIGTNAAQRQNAVALTDAAVSLEKAAGEPPAYPAELPNGHAKPRPDGADGQLDLVEQALRQFAAYPRAWNVVADLARGGQLTEPQKRRWADLVQRMCGPRHPDFALSILGPMVATVADPSEQSGLWDAVFKLVQARPDLAAEVRFRQASLWEKQDNLPRAGQCYEDVIRHYVNAGPFAVQALRRAETVLKKMGEPAKVLDLYAGAVKLVAKPDGAGRSDFMHESNWYKIRELYAARLAAAGQGPAAEQIRAEDGHG